jgi:hypothetical protein
MSINKRRMQSHRARAARTLERNEASLIERISREQLASKQANNKAASESKKVNNESKLVSAADARKERRPTGVMP